MFKTVWFSLAFRLSGSWPHPVYCDWWSLCIYTCDTDDWLLLDEDKLLVVNGCTLIASVLNFVTLL